MIISKIVEIDKVEKLTTQYVEDELKKKSIDPLRWAIVGVKEKKLVISLACVE